MKILIKRIIGFFEFLIGFSVPVWAISSALFIPYYTFKWQYLILLPVYYGFIKYGWMWMFNMVDITDVKSLKPNDEYYQCAKKKALGDIELFLSYLRKGESDCYVLIPKKINNPNSKREWIRAQYLNNEILSLNGKNSTIQINKIDDWYVIKDDILIGHYTFKAVAEKFISNGQNLNKKSEFILNKIVT